MATNQRYTHSEHISLPVPEGTKAGDPVIVGGFAGVAKIDRNEDGNATVWLDGSYMLEVDAAVEAGQPVFLDAPGSRLTTFGNAFFGLVVEAAPGAGLAEVSPAGITQIAVAPSTRE